MPQMSTSQARVADPILSQVALGYKHPERVGRVLFPVVPITTRGAKVIKFDKKSFMKYNTLRAPGASTKRVQFGYASDPVALNGHRLEGLVPLETAQEAQNVPGIDAARDMAINPTMDIFSLSEELSQAETATTATNYDANHKVTLSGTDKWTGGDNSDPKADIKAGKEAVRKTTGFYPNKMVLKPSDFDALDEHPKLQEKFKYTTAGTLTTDMLASYFGIAEVVVGKAVWVPNEDADFEDAWNATVMAYVPPEGTRSMHVPSYGYTYQLVGHPLVEQPYQDRNANSWIYPITDERDVNMTSMNAGFLITGAS